MRDGLAASVNNSGASLWNDTERTIPPLAKTSGRE